MIATMPRKKVPAESAVPPPEPKPRSKRSRARDYGKVRMLSLEITPALDDAIEVCRHKERRTKRAFVELALEEYLKAKGCWQQGTEGQS